MRTLLYLLVIIATTPSASAAPLFRTGRYVVVSESFCLPADGLAFDTVDNLLGCRPFWIPEGEPAAGHEGRFAEWLPHNGYTARLMRFIWDGSRRYGRIIIPEELSGPQWVKRFPTSRSTADLTPRFRRRVDRFVSAMRKAGASVRISATYRPPERAYLMHCAYGIAREHLDPRSIPSMLGVDISWVHWKPNGKPDLAASKRAAESMVWGYNIAYPAALYSLHVERRAIDMTISWNGVLAVRDASGRIVKITSGPRSGNNRTLWRVGRSYGVYKFAPDPPHWSDVPMR